MKTNFTLYINNNFSKAVCLVGLTLGINANLAAQMHEPANLLDANKLIEQVTLNRLNSRSETDYKHSESKRANLKSLPGKSKNYFYNNPDSSWNQYSNTVYTYNTGGKIISAVDKSPDDEYTLNRTFYSYDNYGNDTLELNQNWIDSSWISYNGKRKLITYNANAKITSITYQSFYDNEDWANIYKDSIVYDEEGRVTEEIYVEWLDSNEWEIVERTQNIYNAGASSPHIANFQDYIDNNWVERGRAINISWHNFDKEQLLSYVYQTFKSGAFADTYNIGFTYDNNGGSVVIIQARDNNEWINLIRESDLRDNMKNETGYISEDWIDGNWKIYSAYAYDLQYNSTGDLIEQVKKEYDRITDSYYFTDKKEFSDFSYITSAPKTSALDIKLYPNPTADFVTLESAVTGNATIRIIDLTGRIVINQPLQQLANQNIDLSSLKAGIYILTVDSKEGRFVAKVVKQ